LNEQTLQDLQNLRNRKKSADQRSEWALSNVGILAAESQRVAEVAHNSANILQDLDREFESQTALTSTDVAFLLFATALQCVRWAFVTKFADKISHDEADKQVGKKSHDLLYRSKELYNPPLQEIIVNPVPFDAMVGSTDFDLGLSGRNHRYKTLGHDPILGWLFGTANIATATLTAWDFSSYHIKSGELNGRTYKEMIKEQASTAEVMLYSKEKLLNEGLEGKKIIASSLIKEAIHLRSDLPSYKSLPLPIIQAFDPKLAEQLATYGLDTANVLTVGKQATFAILINAIITMLHSLCYNPEKDGDKRLYHVRSRRIVTYSNLISSFSNVLWVALAKDFNRLDIGGIAVTVFRLISDGVFIRKLKQEFVEENFLKMVRGEELLLTDEDLAENIENTIQQLDL